MCFTRLSAITKRGLVALPGHSKPALGVMSSICWLAVFSIAEQWRRARACKMEAKAREILQVLCRVPCSGCGS